MPIVAGDLAWRLSGGSGNTAGDSSLGGAISSTAVPGTLHGLFDRVTGAESDAGDIEYRCVYVRNGHGSLTLYGAQVWIETNTPSSSTSVDVGLGTSAINGTEQTIANESTAPSGVTFSSAAGALNAITIGDIPAGQHKAIWIRRTVVAGAAAYNADGAELRFRGDTGA